MYIIAEMSANHGGSLEHACEVVRQAAACGVDAVKLQTYTADTLTIDSDAPPFRIGKDSLWANRTLYNLYQEAYTPWEWQPELKQVADAEGIAPFSTPFDSTAVSFLEEMSVPAHKIASFEVVDLALVECIARTGKPIIMSTGMATLAEIDEAVAAVRKSGNRQLALLKCTSAHPGAPRRNAPADDSAPGSGLRRAGGALGSHDGHSGPGGVGRSGSVHHREALCLCGEGGPDSSFSLEPAELRQLVRDVRMAERALGTVDYGVSPKEQASRVFRRSLFVVADMAAGEAFTSANVRSIRPGHGLAPKYIDHVLGRRAATEIARGTPLTWQLVGA